jgi:hypothetical protein
MVILSKSLQPQAVFEFDAEILILFHSSTINTRYQTMMHCGSVRQTAKIVSIGERTVLRTGDRAIVRFRFLQHPEYLKLGTRLLFRYKTSCKLITSREGRTKGVGKIVATIARENEIGGEKGNPQGVARPRATKEEQFFNRQKAKLLKEQGVYAPSSQGVKENSLGDIFNAEDAVRARDVPHNNGRIRKGERK